MQGDLISRSDVINLMYEVFEDYSVATDKQDKLGGFGSKIFERVKELPTAYDVEKVVEQLKEVSFERYGNEGMGGEMVVNFDDAIEIVRNGGKE